MVLQVEPTAVACILRILLRYVVELEAIEARGLSALQLACYSQTVEVSSYKLS